MDFINSYKMLEKLCGEIYGCNHGISSYIDEMMSTPSASRYIRGWNEDLKKLKHYRWVRNKIVHDPDCNEDNMCEENDAEWLDNFYSRIMRQTDPLALYHIATEQRKAYKSRDMYEDDLRMRARGKSNHRFTCFMIFITCVMIVIAAVLILKFLTLTIL